MAKATKEELVEAYEEIIEVMDLKENKKPIVVDLDAEDDFLINKITEAWKLKEAGDKFTDETVATVEGLLEPAEEVAPARGKSKASKVTKAAKEEAKEDDAPAEKKPKGKKPEKAGEPGKPGIIATIVSLIEAAGKKGISKEAILKELQADFPGRDEKSMKNTINVQVPARISKEKFKLVKLENGNFAKV